MSSERDARLARRLDAFLGRRRTETATLERELAELSRSWEAAELLPWWQAPRAESSRDGGPPPARGVGPTSLTVIVPVHNAADALRTCLWSLARHTRYPAELLLIDDASTDPRVEDLLERAGRLSDVRVLHNVENLGFTATVNRGLRACAGDIVLLNSDTEVTPRWLESLVLCAYSNPRIGTVTPISDNAGAFSVPRIDPDNPLPKHLATEDVARLLARVATGERVESPTGNGFCMYIKRALVEQVGIFDAEAFPRGYGEENDLCMRALAVGWRHVVDDRTFVRHQRQASFGASKAALAAAARRRLDERYPDYTARVRAFVTDPAIARVRERAAIVLAHAPERGEEPGVLPRVLVVVHEGGGGAVGTTRDLMRGIADEFECFVFTSDRHTLRLRDREDRVLQEWPLERGIVFSDYSRADYRDAFAATLERCAPDLVHIRHLFKHTFDAPGMAAARQLPVVMSFHDHYCVCPTIHLLDDHGSHCGGICTPGHGTCPTLRAGRLPTLKHAYVHQWRDEVDAALQGVDAFVTTSPGTRDVHQRTLAVTRQRPFALIEHGRDLVQTSGLLEAPSPGGRVRILVPGNMELHKGARLLEQMLEHDRGGRLELHLAGEVPVRWGRLGVSHGRYERDALAATVAHVRPAFIGVFSIVAETYCHTLTEAWGCGVPVLATDLGAQAERVRSHGGGFLVPHDDPSAALAAILRAADDPQRYRVQAALATLDGVSDVGQMSRRYADLYHDVLDRRRAWAAPAAAAGDPLGRGVWRAAMLAAEPGAPRTRSLRRYTCPAVAWKLRATAGLTIAHDAELAVISPAECPLDAVEAALDDAEARGLPVVADVDAASFGTIPPYLLERLVTSAKLVIVPREDLAEAVGAAQDRVAVVDERLDPRTDGAAELLAMLGLVIRQARCDAAPLAAATLRRPHETDNGD